MFNLINPYIDSGIESCMFNLSLIGHVSFNRVVTLNFLLNSISSDCLLIFKPLHHLFKRNSLNANFLQLYHLSNRDTHFYTINFKQFIFQPWNAYLTEIPNFHTLNWFIMQLYHPTSPVQRNYPIFTPLTNLLSNYATYPQEIS